MRGIDWKEDWGKVKICEYHMGFEVVKNMDFLFRKSNPV